MSAPEELDFAEILKNIDEWRRIAEATHGVSVSGEAFGTALAEAIEACEVAARKVHPFGKTFKEWANLLRHTRGLVNTAVASAAAFETMRAQIALHDAAVRGQQP